MDERRLAEITHTPADYESVQSYAKGVLDGTMKNATPNVVGSLLAALRESWRERDGRVEELRDLEVERDSLAAQVGEMRDVLERLVTMGLPSCLTREQGLAVREASKPMSDDALHILSLPAPAALARLTARIEARVWRKAADVVPNAPGSGKLWFLDRAAEAEKRAGGGK